jgi:hypothetical protein
MKNNLLNNFLLYIVLPVLFLAQSTTVSAIVMRHDVDRELYLLDTYNYQSAIYADVCSVTLITPRWALTAGHCVDPKLGLSAAIFGKLTILDQRITIKAIYSHPAYSTGIHDIALVELLEPIYTIEPTPPYEGSDELGETLKLAGYGGLGNAVDGLDRYDGRSLLHGADNVTSVANDYHLGFKFDNPADGTSLPLEGVGGPGDSGGPAYIETSAGRFVAGVSSFGDQYYGGSDYYTRVSQELNWIKEVMKEEYPGNYTGPLYSEVKHNDKVPDYAGVGGGRSTGGSSKPGYVLLLTIILFSRKGKVLRRNR